MSPFIDRKDHPPATIQRLEALEAQYGTSPSPDRRTIGSNDVPTPKRTRRHPVAQQKRQNMFQGSRPCRSLQQRSPAHTPVSQQSSNTRINWKDPLSHKQRIALRRWGITFDGTSDPLRFIERLEERAASYRINTEYIPQAIPELLGGTAVDWFRTTRLQGERKVFRAEFLYFFSPPRYFQRLEDDIRVRYQRTNVFKKYLLEIRLMIRRAGYTGPGTGEGIRKYAAGIPAIREEGRHYNIKGPHSPRHELRSNTRTRTESAAMEPVSKAD